MNEQSILAITKVADLRMLLPINFAGCDLTSASIRHIFEVCDALWLHSDDPKDPHAELTSGKCSNGFIDVLRALRFTNICQIMAQQMLRRIREKYTGPIDWVIGSDHAGAALSHSVAILLNSQHDFTEKGPDKTQVWKRFQIKPEEVVLQVEELMTTAGTLQAVRDGIRKGNPGPVTFTPFVAVLVHRSDICEIEGDPVIHLVHYNISVWDPPCPLCKAGSERLRPKENWEKLTGRT